MKYPKLREIKEAIRALLSKPYTTKFPHQKHIPYPSFRGKPYFYEEDCVGCTACVNVCPTGALSFKDVKSGSGYKRILKVRWDICIECGQCQLHCLTEKGIILSNEFDISVTENREQLFQRIEKELFVCEICEKPIATSEHIFWTINKLGPLFVSNTSLISLHQKELLVRDDVGKGEEKILRYDRFRIVCPHCRRKLVITS
ncbi:MAG: 4Fe-4S dicluster domain-containing protein [Candidatus Omnitrophica bacterium]|nr:4Fe-4S dicluster domain-containing protein [Candidatus Omnitrophota bacterium]